MSIIGRQYRRTRFVADDQQQHCELFNNDRSLNIGKSLYSLGGPISVNAPYTGRIKSSRCSGLRGRLQWSLDLAKSGKRPGCRVPLWGTRRGNCENHVTPILGTRVLYGKRYYARSASDGRLHCLHFGYAARTANYIPPPLNASSGI